MTASAAHSILLPLSPEEEQHSRAAAALIRERLAAAGGWLAFDDYLELALYAPGLGYYSAGSTKLGREGDFVTAPEISELFSQCVARQCAEVLEGIGGGQILELGAGTGRMAATVLTSLAELGVLPERYAILEVSADLSERQRTLIEQLPAELRERVVWLQRLPETPLRGVMLANEVLDALAFKRFRIRDGLPHELGVGIEGGQFVWREDPAATGRGAPPFADLSAELLAALPDGYLSEACPRVGPWLAGVSECLERGVLLLFDYGFPRAHYYHPQRTDGTLRCYFKHRAHDDPFINIAVQDITAWVDYTRVAEAGFDAGLEITGFVTQAAFLLGTGIEALVAGAIDTPARARLAGEARRLLMPGEMGEAFKVMALGRDLEQPLRGFAHQDLRRYL